MSYCVRKFVLYEVPNLLTVSAILMHVRMLTDFCAIIINIIVLN